jgi:hypothetical protein
MMNIGADLLLINITFAVARSYAAMDFDLGVALGGATVAQDPNAAGGVLDFVEGLPDEGRDRHYFALDDDGGTFGLGCEVANRGGRRWIQARKNFGGIGVAGGGANAEGEAEHG